MKTLRDVLCDRCVAVLETRAVLTGNAGVKINADDLCRRCEVRMEAWMEEFEERKANGTLYNDAPED